MAASEVPSDKMTSAPATVKDDGDAEGEVSRDDDAGPAPVIEVGDAEVPVVDDLPLGNDGRRDLKAEAISLEHMMTHTPFNGHCPSCVRAKMVRKPARRIDQDPALAPKKFGDLVNADHIIAHSDEAMGLTRERDALAVVDRYSDYVIASPHDQDGR